jgi:hypothetical protein
MRSFSLLTDPAAWRLSPKLTIDAGLRYEYIEPYVDRSGRLTSVQVPALVYGVVNLPSNLHEVFVRSVRGQASSIPR